MSDTISRSDAIEQIQTWAVNLINPKMLSREDAIYILESMPTAQPEQKKGEWINRSLNILYPAFERYTCSVCGKHSYSYDFCPHCGSYNGGENHDKG